MHLELLSDLKTGEIADSCNARQPIYVYSQSMFRILNSEYAFHFICVFSVDFQKHASEYEVVVHDPEKQYVPLTATYRNRRV